MRLVLWLCLSLAIIAGGVSYGLSKFNDYLVANGPNAEETIVVLPRGAGLQSIVRRLDDAGVIQHPWLFQFAVRLGGHERQLKAGEYAFPAKVTASSLTVLLLLSIEFYDAARIRLHSPAD